MTERQSICMTTQNITNRTKKQNILRVGLGVLLRVLEKFSIDESKLVSNGLLRDRYIEQQYSKCKEDTHI